ncbi:MAG: precorrin-2 C(20)-methyltransferase [Chloroflexi bacterium]|nr:precorrin-2 C(20)-methyltransferase [Chloroflexota bacterium]MCL5109346.1 precorrin-2 C(20)-methyltransferase [Chloroflexota bacterium]
MATSQESQPAWGKFIGVGVGPGDPELITIKAQRVLQQVPVLCVPKSREEGDSYVLSFVSHLIDLERQALIELVFPMTKDRARLEEHWSAALVKVVAHLREGQDVAFVTEGDPFIYSTFMHIYALVRARYPEAPVEVIPGISSINAAAAAAGLPLVDGAERLAVLPATYEGERLEEVLRQFDTIVLLKVNRVFERVLASLSKLGLAERAVYVKRCGSPEQEIVRDIGELRGQELDYLSLIIVRK